MESILLLEFTVCLYVTHALAARTRESDSSWCVDSAASKHVTGNDEAIDNLQSIPETKSVKSAGGQSHQIQGSGDVMFRLENGEIKQVSNVFYVPGLTKNLLSVGSLTDAGLIAIFDSDKCLIVTKQQPPKFVARGFRAKKNGLYKLDAVTVKICPLKLWAEAVNTANQLVNFSPTKANSGLTRSQRKP